MRLGVETDAAGLPVEGSGYLAPKVAEEKCIGCGLCQTRCYKINAKQKRLLAATAIRVVAGEGKEDRLLRGSVHENRSRPDQSGPPTHPSPNKPQRLHHRLLIWRRHASCIDGNSLQLSSSTGWLTATWRNWPIVCESFLFAMNCFHDQGGPKPSAEAESVCPLRCFSKRFLNTDTPVGELGEAF